tara:strand:+ start:67 stop:444 length:378 start_codon:yes stop_codon:yes gene_type:complete
MEIMDEDDEEIRKLMTRISRKEITLCEGCDTFFDYEPQRKFCDVCRKKKKKEIRERHEEARRAYRNRPEQKEKKRLYDAEYRKRPESIARRKARAKVLKKDAARIKRKREYAREYYRNKKRDMGD